MRLLALALLAVPALVSAQPIDPLPVIYLPGGAFEEGCSAQWSTRSAIRAYSAPTAVSNAIRTVDAERRIDANDFSESLTAVLQTGLVRARQSVTFEAYDVRTERTSSIQLAAGDELEVFGSAGEGAVYVSHGGRVAIGFVPGMYGGDGEVELLREPVTELWVRLIEHGPDRPASWVNVSQAGVAERETICF